MEINNDDLASTPETLERQVASWGYLQTAKKRSKAHEDKSSLGSLSHSVNDRESV